MFSGEDFFSNLIIQEEKNKNLVIVNSKWKVTIEPFEIIDLDKTKVLLRNMVHS